MQEVSVSSSVLIVFKRDFQFLEMYFMGQNIPPELKILCLLNG